jgi:hypothetical protein
VHPGRAEVPCNGKDDDCDPATPDGPDADDDGWSACAGDCDDGDPEVHPGRAEVPCNGRDDDCDPTTPDDADADDDGVSLCAADCNDDDPAVGACEEGEECLAGACVLPGCPPEMALVGALCIDRYEASRPDATSTSPGSDSSRATSRPDVIPWNVATMNATAFDTFRAACEAAGKRLCHADEWLPACAGSEGRRYVFGDVWDPEICNSVDTFCDDYCSAQGIVPCNTNENCGYQYYCFHVVATAQFADCVNEYGMYDVNGNVWEIVVSDTDARGYETRGGAFNCGAPSARFDCTFNANWAQLYAGFRCCQDL